MATHNSTMLQRLRPFFSVRAISISVAVLLFVVICVLPIAYMFAVSLAGTDGSFSFENYRQLVFDRRQSELLLNSTMLGAGSALVATVLGAPLGLVLARTHLPAKRMLRIALVIPLVVPPYVLALAWILVSGPTGFVAQVLVRDLISPWTYSLIGAVLVLGFGFYPLSMLATEAAARRVDGHLEEAALLATSQRRVLWRITLPLIGPTVAATFLIIFVLALAEFGVPGLLRVRVYTTEIFTAFAALYDFGAATALAIPLLVVALMAGVAIKLINGERLLATRRSVHPGLPLRLGRWRIPVFTGIALIICTCVALPLAALIAEAGHVERIALAAQSSGNAVANSLMLAVTGATLITTLAVLLGYGHGRAQKARWRNIFDLVFIVTFAMPSTVVGVGLIALWNRPGLFAEIYSSQSIIVIAYLARFTPVAALILAASMRQIPGSFEEAADVAGSRWPHTFMRIILPQLRTGVTAAWVVAFIFAFGELGATVLVAPPGESTLPVRVYTLIANSPSSEVAALALMQVGILLAPLAFLGFFVRGPGQREGRR